MDGQRFDELVKAFAVRRSRRTVLRTALSGMGAGLLGLVGGTGASADQGPVPCGEIEGLECSEGFTCVDGFCLADDDQRGRNPLGEDFDPLGEDFDPLAGTPTLCGQGVFLTVCGSDEYCCNESCGICAPIGGSCTQEFCGED